MISFFRRVMYSKFGVAVTLIFVVILGLAFAAGDVTGLSGAGPLGGGDRVASVGGNSITTSDLGQAITSQVDQARQQDPKVTTKSFLAQGGLEPLLADLIDRLAILGWGEKHGLTPSSRLIDSEIAKIDSFQGLDGKFSNQTYQQVIRQRGFTDKQVRQDLAESLAGRMLLSPAEIAAMMPQAATLRYAGVVTEHRRGAIALLPSAVFAPKVAPGDAEIQAYYRAHVTDYQRPDRRILRYATFTDAALKTLPAPTEVEVAAAYGNAKARFAASETRTIAQLILPTEAAARAVLAEVQGGKTLESSAAAKGLSVAKLSIASKDQLSGQTSAAIADATFGAAQGKVSGPGKGPLGWYLMRVDAVTAKAGKTLDQARGEIVIALTTSKRRAALTDFSAKIEDEFDNGSTLAEVAKELGLPVVETAPLTADGGVYGEPGKTAPADLAKIIPSAFAMESEGQPQLAEIEPGKTFAVYDVRTIARAAPAPLAEVRGQVATDLSLSQGSAAARAAAQKIEAAVKGGKDIGAAMAALGLPLPPVDRVDTGREQLQQMKQVPPPVQVLFSMASGKLRVVGAPRNRGWYVIKLDAVTPGQVAPNDPRLGQLGQELSKVVAREYSQQLAAAMRAELGVKRNPDAIRGVTARLVGN